ncbi:MAG: MarR family winged helix-turn-helix transcriptional regulator, partial [Glycocaulis sp.]
MPKSVPPAKADQQALYFRLLNEIGIIAQLSANRLERVLPHDLTVAQFSLLHHCVRLGDGWTPARLAAAFQVTRGTMTNTLQKLEAKGFIRLE